jgi:hypothetical protein
MVKKKNLFSFGMLKATDEKSSIRARSLSQWYGSAVPDQDRYQNVMDPQHRYITYCTSCKRRYTRNTHIENNLFMADSPYFSGGIYVPSAGLRIRIDLMRIRIRIRIQHFSNCRSGSRV